MLTERITLPPLDGTPGEQWAEIRAVKELRSGDRKAVRRAWTLDIGDDGKVSKSMTMADEDDQREVLLARLIVNWSLPADSFPLPAADPDVLDRLPLDIYDALMDATEEHFAVVDFSQSGTRDGTGGSSDSGTGAEATSSPDSNPTPN